jgi:hypothetical protein
MNANELHQLWFALLVSGIQSDLHDREYTVAYNKHTAEVVLEETKQAHREARAFDPSIPDFDNRTFRRALNQALKTLDTAKEHYTRIDAIGKMAP